MSDPTRTSRANDWIARTVAAARALAPGVLIATLIALASRFVAEHYGAPTMLMALLFGIALNFLASDPTIRAGVEFGSKQLLRLGVALLGVRITADVIAVLGWKVALMVVLGVAATIGFGLATSRLFGFKARFGFLSSGAVAICGASAAMAIAAILPKDEHSEQRLVFTVVGVTLLSTVAMILYPVFSAELGFDDRTAGVFIGATVHDVAQVVGAGFSISEEAGDTSALVKLFRVVLLAPVVIAAALVIRAHASKRTEDQQRPPLAPTFVIGFIALAVASSLGLLPRPVVDMASSASSWLLVIAIASVGMRTFPKDILNVGLPAVAFLVAETVFLGLFVLAAIMFFDVQS